MSEARLLQAASQPGTALLSSSESPLLDRASKLHALDESSNTFGFLLSTTTDEKADASVSKIASEVAQGLNENYPQHLITLMQQAISSPGGLELFATILNEMITQSNCDQVLPLIHELYPHSAASISQLGSPEAALHSIAIRYPALSQCALTGP